METDFKYHLDKTSRKFECPSCKKKTFVKFKNIEGNYQSDEFGRCDRQANCNYYQYPNIKSNTSEKTFEPKKIIPKKQVYIPEDVFLKTLKGYDQNIFLNNLLNKGIPSDSISKISNDYYLGTLTKGAYLGAVTFPFIDENGRVNAIQVKRFNEENKTTENAWLHSILYKGYKKTNNVPEWITSYYENDKKTKCLFGIHLIKKYPDKKIIVVESAKNAILGAIFLPEYIWLASGSLGNIQAYKFKALKGKEVILIPDTSKDSIAFEQWKFKADEINKTEGTNIKINDFLECIATEKQKLEGYDIADFLMENPEHSLIKNLEEKSAIKILEENYTELQRTKAGMEFSRDELLKLAEKLIPKNDARTETELILTLKKEEGLNLQDATDLLMVMRMKNIIDHTPPPFNNYYLFDSTPF